MFVKDFGCLSKKEVEKLYEHSMEILKCCSGYYIFPQPICYDNKSITYEFVTLPESITKIICKQTESSLAKEALFQSGKALCLIHSKKNLLHGDYVGHNLFYSYEQGLSIIDAHPPEVIGFDLTYLYGRKEVEVVFFLTSLPISYGIKRSLYEYRKITSFISYAYQGYTEANKISLSIRDYFRVFLRISNINRKSKIGLIKGCIYGFFSTFIVMGALYNDI
ncbi:hypothetical protein MACH09_01630 [Vibrio sp. MACH09]|uniref:hypothetical protein n=1 Tax=Vibrio sp. MACH09 TaxID=3025122 RepID=UPI00278EEAFA|nr:hypothetical protein [Vibrio sp. MACH09]GLO59655.1 hypothetical protein MACH09_01630 [Vibrio sp. MACH09]